MARIDNENRYEVHVVILIEAEPETGKILIELRILKSLGNNLL